MRAGGSEQMAWLQICEPTEKDKGKYTFEISDGQDAHQRSLDLSGQGEPRTQREMGEQKTALSKKGGGWSGDTYCRTFALHVLT